MMNTRIQIAISVIIGMILGSGIFLGFMISPLSADFRKGLDPCPYIFQEIKLLEITKEMQLSDSKAVEKHTTLLQSYTNNKCPTYEGLELQLQDHKLNNT